MLASVGDCPFESFPAVVAPFNFSMDSSSKLTISQLLVASPSKACSLDCPTFRAPDTDDPGSSMAILFSISNFSTMNVGKTANINQVKIDHHVQANIISNISHTKIQR
ncbi:hypothetical protein V6Z12_D13G066500 [Gossypium hirsutum]